ncbi:Hypothetical protein R9X50_00634900 [Acrodontium crateriforme]|uniref:Uncharacterized protein n=1 Tax=Acrodontium crateriforme TaxID=150365 RepID=A0AAQ3M859_9PEZI|nr:Hypothetical protein R9X50_00634900 [Acrodontium crateriforme]
MDNNPALTTPAVPRLPSQQQSDATGSTSSEPSNHSNERLKATKSAGVNSAQSTPSKYSHGWRRIVRNFSPSWFSVTMGTGVVSTIFITIPWKADWLYHLGIAFFALNVILFICAFVASCVRYTIWPEIWSVMIDDPTNSLFLGTIPMGFATIVEMWTFVCVPAWGTWAAHVAWALWMVDSIVALSITISLGVLLMSASHQRSLDSITAAQLLPIAATIVAAGTGAEVSSVLPNPHHALGTIIASYVMWGMATPMSVSVLVIYYQRLALHKMPSREVIVSAFLPIGPLGFGGYTILYLGKMAAEIFPRTGTIDPLAGRVAFILGFFVAIIMWGWGLVWLAFALASIYKARPFPLNLGWWGFIFPLGVYSVSTILIGELLPSLFFKVLGTIFSTIVIMLWVLVAGLTARGAWEGHLFHAPCLANLRPRTEVVPRSSSEVEKQVDGQHAANDVKDVGLMPQDSREAPDILR